jgi:hypothetical protein
MVPVIPDCNLPERNDFGRFFPTSFTSVLEDVGRVPPQQVELGAVGQKFETGGGKIASAFACQQGVETVP